MTHDPVVIASYARTPMGGFQGALSGASAIDMGTLDRGLDRGGAQFGG
ncbi:MAG: acetyl-CoA C-acetyltransferase, partial [Rhizorhabdus sp.]